MFSWRVAARAQPMINWWADGNQIAFSRGAAPTAALAFVALNNARESMRQLLFAGLPSGRYCDIISGDFTRNSSGTFCSGTIARVDAQRRVQVAIDLAAENQVFALHVDAKM